MSEAPFMPLYCGDYLADTKDLDIAQHGAYLMILMVTWRNRGEPLPDDDKVLARICGLRIDVWRKRFRPVLTKFFDLASGFWRQKRLDKEWLWVQKRGDISRANGAKGGRPKALKSQKTQNPAGSPQVSIARASSTSTQEKEDSVANATALPRDPVDEVWARGLVIVGTKNRPLLGKLCQQHGNVAVLEAIVITEQETRADPLSFLLGCLKRHGGNGHGGKQSPGDNLIEGAWRAVEARAARRGAGEPLVEALLDSGRSSGEPASPDRGLARGFG
jgi:uncharacterized protein YdaU (DUF1376 family)